MKSKKTSNGKSQLDINSESTYRIAVSKLDTNVLWRITKMAFRHRLRMAIGIVSTILAATFQLFVPQFLGRAVDQAHGLLTLTADRAATEDALMTTALLLISASLLR